MARETQEPVVTIEDGPTGGEIRKHPAYGQISASRVTCGGVGGGMPLYGSDFKHSSFINIRINASEHIRSLSHDRYHPGKRYIEVALSEAQWATFVSSLNQGSGPCCTIESVAGKMIPGLPDPPSRVKQFSGEVDEHMQECIDAVNETMDKIDALGLSQKKAKELKEGLVKTVQHLKHNLPFVAESFSKHAEHTVEKAKVEIHGYMEGVLNRAGVAAIQGQMPLMIESGSTEVSRATDGL